MSLLNFLGKNYSERSETAANSRKRRFRKVDFRGQGHIPSIATYRELSDFAMERAGRKELLRNYDSGPKTRPRRAPCESGLRKIHVQSAVL